MIPRRLENELFSVNYEVFFEKPLLFRVFLSLNYLGNRTRYKKTSPLLNSALKNASKSYIAFHKKNILQYFIS